MRVFLKRVCVFFAAAFLIVDMFLIVLYFQARKDFSLLSDNMVKNTLEYYKSSGVEINENVIQHSIPMNPIYTFDSSNMDCAPYVAEKLASKMFFSGMSVSFVETPNGISYSLSDSEGIRASFRVYKDVFAFEYSADEFSKENAPLILAEVYENAGVELQSSIRKNIDKFTKAISTSADSEYKVDNVMKTNIGTIVNISQLADKSYPINDMYMNMLFKENRLVYAEGNWILGDIKKSYNEQLTDGINALNKIDISTMSKVISEEITYMYRNSGRGQYYLVPVWKIEYIDTNGTPKTQYIDAIKS